MRLNYILIIFSLLICQLSLAQEDIWDVYMAQYEDGVGSTLINMSAKSYAPDKKFPFVLVVGVTFADCNTDGMPEKKQFSELYAISDSVKSIVNRITENKLVGTFTCKCERLDYIYLKDTVRIRESIFKLFSKSFQSYKLYLNLKEDKSWKYYLSFLYPNEETLEYMQNQKVLLELEKAGDKHDKPRQVDHWIYFETEKNRNCYIEYIGKNNFKIESTKKVEEGELPFALHISRNDIVEISSISKLTLELRKQALKCKGEYDGWETFIVN